MSCLSAAYTGDRGIYASVKLNTEVAEAAISSLVPYSFERVEREDLHVTVVFSDTSAPPREAIERFLGDRDITPPANGRRQSRQMG